MPIFDATSLPYPSKGQLPRADWFVTYSQALRVLAGAVESLQGGSAETGMLRLAKTVAGDGTYPTRSAMPNCFNIKFRNLHDFESTAGLQTVTKANRHDDSDQDAVVLNLAALGTWNTAYYIPVDTDIWCFGLGGKWFTWFNQSEMAIATLTSSWTGNTASATLRDMDDASMGTAITVYDTLGVFGTLPSGSRLYVVLQGGSYYAIQAACPTL